MDTAIAARGVRDLTRAQLVTSLGDGAYFTCFAVFLTRHLGFSQQHAALVLSAGWALGSVTGLLAGQVSDRRGAVPVAVTWCVAGAAGVAALAAGGPAAVTVAACIAYAAAQCSLATTRQALVAELVPPAERARFTARLQVVTNAGLGVGAVLGGLALALDVLWAYQVVLAADAASFLVCAALLTRPRRRTRPGAPAPGATPGTNPRAVPGTHPGTAPGRHAAARAAGPRPTGPGVLRDPAYLGVTALNAVLLLRMPLLTVVLPLWVAARTEVPLVTVSAAFALNTCAVLAFQLRAATGIVDVRTAARAVRRGGALLAVSCLAFLCTATQAPGGAATAVALLMLGAAVQVGGELLQSAGSWLLSYQLAPEGRHGQYQGAFGAGTAVARALGPVVLVGAVLDAGAAGWLVLASAFAAAGALTPPVAVRAARRARLTPEPPPLGPVGARATLARPPA